MSGKKPIAVSGIASDARSVTTRADPCTEIAQPAAERVAVDQRGVRLGVAGDQRVERVLGGEVGPHRLVVAAHAGLAHGPDVAAGAERLGRGAADDDRAHRVVVPPVPERVGDQPDHRQVQRVQRPRPVQLDHRGPGRADTGGHGRRGRPVAAGGGLGGLVHGTPDGRTGWRRGAPRAASIQTPGPGPARGGAGRPRTRAVRVPEQVADVRAALVGSRWAVTGALGWGQPSGSGS